MSTITASRRPSRPRRPVSAEVPLTEDGRRMLEQRLASLYTVAMPELRPLLAARERDERDVAAFERLVAEAQRLESVLARAVPAPVDGDGRVVLGSRVLVGMPDGETVLVRPVHPAEAALDDERVSLGSPLSQALLGARVGDRVAVRGPAGDWDAEVLDLVPPLTDVVPEKALRNGT